MFYFRCLPVCLLVCAHNYTLSVCLLPCLSLSIRLSACLSMSPPLSVSPFSTSLSLPAHRGVQREEQDRGGNCCMNKAEQETSEPNNGGSWRSMLKSPSAPASARLSACLEFASQKVNRIQIVPRVDSRLSFSRANMTPPPSSSSTSPPPHPTTTTTPIPSDGV